MASIPLFPPMAPASHVAASPVVAVALIGGKQLSISSPFEAQQTFQVLLQAALAVHAQMAKTEESSSEAPRVIVPGVGAGMAGW